jgi:hypothetical protein
MVQHAHLEWLQFLSVHRQAQSEVLHPRSWWVQTNPGTFRTASAVLCIESLLFRERKKEEERKKMNNNKTLGRKKEGKTAPQWTSEAVACWDTEPRIPGLLCAT